MHHYQKKDLHDTQLKQQHHQKQQQEEEDRIAKKLSKELNYFKIKEYNSNHKHKPKTVVKVYLPPETS